MKQVDIPQNTSEALIEAATGLFSTHGFESTTVKDIADKAGVNVSLVSYHFDGKENLYRACLDKFGRSRLAVAERVLVPPSSSEELRVRLQMFIQEMIGCHLEQPEVAKMVHRECELELPRFQDIFQATFLKVFERMLGFLKVAQENGLIRKDVDVQVAAALFFGSMFHMLRVDSISQRYFNLSVRDPKYREKVTDHLLKIYLKGLSS